MPASDVLRGPMIGVTCPGPDEAATKPSSGSRYDVGRSPNTNAASNIGANTKATTAKAEQRTFTSTTPPSRQAPVVRVDRHTVDVVTSLELHQSLRLRRAHVEDAACFEQYLSDQGVRRRKLPFHLAD